MQNTSGKSILAAAIAAAGLTGCAPEAFNNLQARGFNSYLATLQEQCRNFYIGPYNIQAWLRNGGDNDVDEYTYWLDQTSRLYYNRITFDQYRNSITGSLGGGAYNTQSFDCIRRLLPAHRPDSP